MTKAIKLSATAIARNKARDTLVSATQALVSHDMEGANKHQAFANAWAAGLKAGVTEKEADAIATRVALMTRFKITSAQADKITERGAKRTDEQVTALATFRQLKKRSLDLLATGAGSVRAAGRKAKAKRKPAGQTTQTAAPVTAPPATLKAVIAPRVAKPAEIGLFFGDMAALLDRFAKTNAKALTVDMRPHLEIIRAELAKLATLEKK